MKKIYSFLAASALIMGMASCSNEDVTSKDNEGKGATAYLMVKIADAPSTRGTTTDDQIGYDQATEAEYKVTTADFYFYDEHGVFVSKANAWTDGAEYDADDNLLTENIDYKSGAVIVLKGLKEKAYPKYMVTVCNKPSDFDDPAPGSTLDEFEARLARANTVTDGQFKNGTNFIMSTTSYKNGKISPFVTELTADNFQNDPLTPLDASKYVTVYVERLAAKVIVGVDLSHPGEGHRLEATSTPGVYKMDLTIAGNDNSQNGGTNIGDEVVYVQFTNWALNVTSKRSYMVKHIDQTWSTETGNSLVYFPWNDSDRFRSYWGMSVGYDKFDKNNYNYLKQGDLVSLLETSGTPLDGAAYCAENTLKGSEFDFAGATTVTIGARIYSDEACTTSPTLIRYRGVVYTESNYIKNELRVLQESNHLNFFKKTSAPGDDPETFEQIGVGDVVLVNVGNGNVILKTNLANDTKLYAEGLDADNKKIYTLIANNAVGNAVAQLNKEFENYNATNTAAIYTDGIMLYRIPIEHLNNAGTPVEGQYGIVRNHVYKLTINSLKGLGEGVYDPSKGGQSPDEPDEPEDPEDPEQLYQVGATINILSWKIVYQNGVALQ